VRAEGCRDDRELVEGGLEVVDDFGGDDLEAVRFSGSSRDSSRSQKMSVMPCRAMSLS
jgi:hypothetical protein